MADATLRKYWRNMRHWENHNEELLHRISAGEMRLRMHKPGQPVPTFQVCETVANPVCCHLGIPQVGLRVVNHPQKKNISIKARGVNIIRGFLVSRLFTHWVNPDMYPVWRNIIRQRGKGLAQLLRELMTRLAQHLDILFQLPPMCFSKRSAPIYREGAIDFPGEQPYEVYMRPITSSDPVYGDLSSLHLDNNVSDVVMAPFMQRHQAWLDSMLTALHQELPFEVCRCCMSLCMLLRSTPSPNKRHQPFHSPLHHSLLCQDGPEDSNDSSSTTARSQPRGRTAPLPRPPPRPRQRSSTPSSRDNSSRMSPEEGAAEAILSLKQNDAARKTTHAASAKKRGARKATRAPARVVRPRAVTPAPVEPLPAVVPAAPQVLLRASRQLPFAGCQQHLLLSLLKMPDTPTLPWTPRSSLPPWTSPEHSWPGLLHPLPPPGWVTGDPTPPQAMPLLTQPVPQLAAPHQHSHAAATIDPAFCMIHCMLAAPDTMAPRTPIKRTHSADDTQDQRAPLRTRVGH